MMMRSLLRVGSAAASALAFLLLFHGAPDSLRIDIPKDDVAPENRRVEGVRLFDTDRPAILDMEPIYKIVNEAEAGGKRRAR